jgi:hypothetical protein
MAGGARVPAEKYAGGNFIDHRTSVVSHFHVSISTPLQDANQATGPCFFIQENNRASSVLPVY